MRYYYSQDGRARQWGNLASPLTGSLELQNDQLQHQKSSGGTITNVYKVRTVTTTGGNAEVQFIQGRGQDLSLRLTAGDSNTMAFVSDPGGPIARWDLPPAGEVSLWTVQVTNSGSGGGSETVEIESEVDDDK